MFPCPTKIEHEKTLQKTCSSRNNFSKQHLINHHKQTYLYQKNNANKQEQTIQKKDAKSKKSTAAVRLQVGRGNGRDLPPLCGQLGCRRARRVYGLSRWPWFQTTRLAMDKQPEMKRGFSVFYWSQLGALNDVVVSFKNEFPKKS